MCKSTPTLVLTEAYAWADLDQVAEVGVSGTAPFPIRIREIDKPHEWLYIWIVAERTRSPSVSLGL